MPRGTAPIQVKSASENSDSAMVRQRLFTMPQFIYNASKLIRRVLFLARPYGRKKLALVFFLSLAQGIFQVIGVTSIFPFLAIAADPERIRHSQFGLRFLALLPPMGNRALLITASVIAIVGLLARSISLRKQNCSKRCTHLPENSRLSWLPIA